MSWPIVTLNDVAEIQGGIQKQPKRTPKVNKFPFLRVANVTSGGLDTTDLHEVELFEGEIERYRLQDGDLLVVEGNGSPKQIGRAAVWDASVANAVHQNHLIRVRPVEDLDSKFLGLLWNSPAIRDELTRVASSTSGLLTLSVSKLKHIAFPLPPLDEQHRIVTLLEDHLSRLDAANSYIKAARQREQTLLECLLAREIATVHHEEVPIGSLIVDGLTNGKSVPTQEDGFPVLRLTAIKGGRIDLTEYKCGAWSATDANRYLVECGDFLVSRGNGSLRLVGRGGLVTDEPAPFAFPDTMIRIRADAERLKPEFLALVWNSKIVRNQIESVARTTAGIYKINQKDLAALRIPLPSLSDQMEVLTRLDWIKRSLVPLRDAAERSEIRSNGLRRSLLKHAFSSDYKAFAWPT